jgi:hypothetical protein
MQHASHQFTDYYPLFKGYHYAAALELVLPLPDATSGR